MLTAKIEKNELVIRIAMNEKPVRSVSGKTLVVCSTHGNIDTGIEVDGRKVFLGLNAYIKDK